MLDPNRMIDGFVGVGLVGERCMHFALAMPTHLAQDVDCAPLDNDAQPRFEGTPGIVGRPGAVDREQYFLHYIVDAVRRDAPTAGEIRAEYRHTAPKIPITHQT